MSSVRGLNASPQMAIVLPASLPPKCASIFSSSTVLLLVVDLVDRVQNPRLDAVLAGQCSQRPHVLGEAAAAVADAGEQKREADAAVVADAAADVVDVGSQPLAEVGHLVDEADLRRQQGVGDVLGHLGAFGRHDQKRLLGAQERGVQLAQHLGHFRASHADDDAVGLHEVVDRGPFLQELGVAGHVARRGRSAPRAGAAIFALVPTGTVLLMTTIASGGRCGASRIDGLPADPSGRPSRRRAAACRRPGRPAGGCDGFASVGREVQPPGRGVALDQLGRPGS